ncbi:MAG: hypothetical protein LBQ05_00585 [Christensenellaceae bacterium]|nr:hypothetical protein [Christensenellaceae bacterium]
MSTLINCLGYWKKQMALGEPLTNANGYLPICLKELAELGERLKKVVEYDKKMNGGKTE